MTPGEMHEALRKAYAQLAAKYGLRTIPTGDAVQLFRDRLPVAYGELLTRDAVAAMEKPAVIDFHGDVVGSSEWRQGNKGGQADWKEVKLRNDFPHLNARGHYLQACVWVGFLFKIDPVAIACIVDFGEVKRLMAIERVAPRFTVHYDYDFPQDEVGARRFATNDLRHYRSVFAS